MCHNLSLAKAPKLLYPRFLLLVVFGLFFSAITLCDSELYAASPITASGLNTQVSAPVVSGSGATQTTQYNITGGTRPGGGANLYHSFGDFNVPTNNIANFINSGSVGLNGAVLPPNLPTANILGRINGGNPSTIFGMIQTNGPGGFPNANLFLMNPNGFLFGPAATISVGGMVAFTTADYMRLNDNTRFNAVAGPADLLLTAAPVTAFGFLGNNPAAIAIQGGTLKVADGQILSLVGGSQGFTATDPDTGNPINVPGGITIAGGKLLAAGGQINIASVAGPGEISSAIYLPTPGMTMGNINLSQGALLDVSADAAGSVRIRGGQLVMESATISADTVVSNGAPVAIDINVTGDVSISAVDVPALTARTTGSGNAGAIQIASTNMDLTGSAPNNFMVSVIDSHTSGSGKAGDVSITAANNLTMAAHDFSLVVAIDSGTTGASVNEAKGGNVTLTAKSISLQGAQINTGIFLDSFTGVRGPGSGGNLTITTDSLKMSDFESINSSIATDGTVRAGNVLISARDVQMTFFSGLSASGPAGSIQITADQLMLDNGSQIFSQTAGESAGGINFTGKVVELTNGSAFSTQTFGTGNAGTISITATDHVTFADDPSIDGSALRGSGLYTNSFGFLGNGNSGAITVTTPSLNISGGARIESSTSSSGHGGNVSIAANAISIQGERPTEPGESFSPALGSARASGIYSRTVSSEFCAGPCGDAGNVFITTGTLNLASGGQLNSGTTGTGNGGNVVVNATGPIAISGSMIDGTPGGILSQAAGTVHGAGGGGSITLSTGQSVTISNDASISANTTGPGHAGTILVNANDISLSAGGTVTASSTGPGNAGTVTIQGITSPANSFLVDGAGSGVFTTTSDVGTGGNTTIDANAVNLQNGAHVSSSSTGPGNTGNIQINAGNQFAMTNSSVTTEANQSGGGIIKITTNPNGTVQLTDSTMSASVLDGSSGGGSVNIDPQSVVLINSQILAQAVQGPGGNITITTNLLLPDSTSLISASSQFGQQGNIVIQSPVSPASGKLIPLGQKPLIATSLLSQRCAALAGGSISSFTVDGRDSLPTEPGGWLSSPVALSTPESEDETIREANGSMSDGTPLLSLRKIAPSGFLTQAFAADSSGCQS
jgi:filamentous hemagglutinin family protein